MLRQHMLLFALTLAMFSFQSGVSAETLDAKYLTGNWELNTDGTCGGNDVEHLVVRDDGTFEYGRRGKAEAVGFWQIEGDVVTLEMITSPGHFEDIDDQMKAYHGSYGYYQMKAMTFGIQQNEFSAVGAIADQMNKFTALRCK